MAPHSSRSTVLPTKPSPLRTRQRKPVSQTINTNVSVYPRTEPIKALNVLLKLLTSLPSRIGGCQYKLTQPEHALSLHLIGILDPFVYHGVRALVPNPVSAGAPHAPSFGLVDQPTEIIDAILFHVDSRKDLFISKLTIYFGKKLIVKLLMLNIGLGCKRLYDVVFPRHFEYRVIRCKVSSISVWNHLVHHRSLARNVRRLEILDERASSRNGSPVCIPRGILQGDTDLESTDDELSMHAKQERFLAAALVRMTGLKEFKWSCNHSPISIAHIWPTLMMRAVNLNSMEICDNLVFAPVKQQDEGESDGESDSEAEDANEKRLMTSIPASALPGMNTVIFRSTPHTYGSAKNPELGRLSAMLHQCINLKHLEVIYIAPRSNVSGTPTQGITPRTRPLADEFLMYGRWENLTTLYLSNLRCVSPEAPSSFLSAHRSLEVLHMDVNVHAALVLTDGALPRLREIKASRDVVNAILVCPSEEKRPLEVIKGFKLSGSNSACQNGPSGSSRSIPDTTFLSNLRQCGSGIRRIELGGWHDMEDIRKLVGCVPNLQYLDVGRRLGGAAAHQHQNATSTANKAQGVATNMVEWAEVMSAMPELTAMHGVRFFYEVSAAAMGTAALATASTTICPTTDSSFSSFNPASSPTPISGPAKPQTQAQAQAHAHTLSMMERSRMRKNDEIAGVLAWKCPKLRRVDYWEEGSGKVIVLLRDREHVHAHDEGGKEREGKFKARWEVRRVRA
ncbi:hypothetical protein M413DRAFT_32197 [Hebeloma cylindrosporum]|uniref:F-box domain-containing protein n=1 Tax=Hebeloma cylindrosporum TaxID=76867 RepID=A0A0C3BGI1_HEBCY|nr:hypothetical protein M413DRAFT_32197 [Hebeloma cylindrosporum h7]